MCIHKHIDICLCICVYVYVHNPDAPKASLGSVSQSLGWVCSPVFEQNFKNHADRLNAETVVCLTWLSYPNDMRGRHSPPHPLGDVRPCIL